MNERSNPIVDVLETCQNGQLIDTLGAACELSEAQCRQALYRLTPEIARLIEERITDEDDYEDLVDILDEEDQVECLDDPTEMLSRGTISDGKDILEILYGSLDDAHAAARRIGPPEGVGEDTFARLMAMAAALTFAAMARRNQQYQLAADLPPGNKGLIATLFNALITGFMQGFREATRRKTRRRRKRSLLEQILGTGTTSRRRSRRKRKSRRRRKTPSLRDLLGDILD
ncbi:MAG: hypothetical protein HKN11_02830 [Rhizobiales bacterium]|nr:hypothetical protein [Hyphomicrobiales bacterium]